jgi:hypothetical protein
VQPQRTAARSFAQWLAADAMPCRGLASAATATGGTTMQHNAVGWFEIYVQDMPRARRFYEQLLGRPLEQLTPPGADSDLEMWALPMEKKAWAPAARW